MVCIECKGSVDHDGLRYCMMCIEKDKKKKEEEKREELLQLSARKRRDKELLKEAEDRLVCGITTGRIETKTCDAIKLKKLTEESRKFNADEYKTTIQQWAYLTCSKLDEKLKECAMRGEDSYRVLTNVIANPGKLPNGNRCYFEWEFREYLTKLINPLEIFKEKLGAGITVESVDYNMYSGLEKYPTSPEDIQFEYKFSW